MMEFKNVKLADIVPFDGRKSLYHTLSAQLPYPPLPAFVVFKEALHNGQLEPKTLFELRKEYTARIEPLPDRDVYLSGVENQPFAPGGEDGTHWFHGAEPDASVLQLATRAFKRLTTVITRPSAANLRRLYTDLDALTIPIQTEDGPRLYNVPVIAWAVPFMRAMMGWAESATSVEQAQMYELGVLLAFQAPDRVPVKVGLLTMASLPGVAHRGQDIDRVLTLGRHDEFTWYAGRFVYQSLKDPTAHLWELAFATNGWGRVMIIHLLFMLFEGGVMPAVLQTWLLLNGSRHNGASEYTAFAIIEAAQLQARLAAEEVDDAVLFAAGRLLKATLEARRFRIDLREWDEGQAMCRAYLAHVEQSVARMKKHDVTFLPAWLLDSSEL